MGLLNEQDKKIVDRYLYLFCYGKNLRSDREFVDLAIKLMSEKVNSEEGYRRQIDQMNQEEPIEIKINKLPTLFDLIKQRLAEGQQRRLEEILRSIKRETEDKEFSVYTQPIEAMMKRKDPDRARVLRKHGIHYNQALRVCKLADG